MKDRIYYMINYDTDWSIHMYLQNSVTDETLLQLYEHHYSILVNNVREMFTDKDYKAIIMNMNPFEDKIKNSVLFYILTCDVLGYNIELNPRFYFKDIEGNWIGYDTSNGKLTRYEEKIEKEIINRLRGE
jgi:late competence protein required for DNA uptake (superfamily II DNA/RNA helicase)